jgi:hypothetical protein
MTTPSHDHPSRSEVFDEVASTIVAPRYYGPPVIFLLGPWLLLVLLVIPPAALLLTIVLALTVLAAPAALLIALPYLLVRRLRARKEAHRSRPASLPTPAHRRVPARSDAKGPRASQPAAGHLAPVKNR